MTTHEENRTLSEILIEYFNAIPEFSPMDNEFYTDDTTPKMRLEIYPMGSPKELYIASGIYQCNQKIGVYCKTFKQSSPDFKPELVLKAAEDILNIEPPDLGQGRKLKKITTVATPTVNERNNDGDVIEYQVFFDIEYLKY